MLKKTSGMLHCEWETQTSRKKKKNQPALNLPLVNYFAIKKKFVTVVSRMPI